MPVTKMAKLIVLISVAALAAAIQDSRYNRGINPRINGATTEVQDITAIPYHVAISVYPTKNKETFCGASLISRKFALTAAVCFDTVVSLKYEAILYFGAASINDTKIARRATKVHKHLKWNSTTAENDIAVVEFPPVPLTDQIQPIRLPPLSQENSDFYGITATVSGRGQASNDVNSRGVLRSGETTVILWVTCLRQQPNIRSTNICTTQQSPGICFGDEGAPLVMTEDDNVKTLIGVGSYKSVDCETSADSVFTKVSSYLVWINAVTSIPIRM